MNEPTVPAQAENPMVPRPAQSVAAQTAASRVIQEVQAAVVLAKQFPRDQVEATKRILQACRRPGLVQGALYQYPKGNTKIIGPSIRLAEAIAREWGNMQFGVVEQEREGGESTMTAFCWDLETNLRGSLEYKVAHVRDSREGGKKELTDERDVYETVANAGSRRLRACILRMIPSDVIDQAVEECNKTMRAQIENIEEEIHGMLEAFRELKVSKAMIEARIQHNIEASSAAELLDLRRIYCSINDGYGVIEDFFKVQTEPAGIAPAGSAAKAKAAAKKAVAKAKSAPITAPGPETDATGIPKDL